MRTLVALIFLASVAHAQSTNCCRKGKAKNWKPYNKGVKWSSSFDKAVEKAKKEGRILMLFHLVGDLDKEGC